MCEFSGPFDPNSVMLYQTYPDPDRAKLLYRNGQQIRKFHLPLILH